MKKFLKYIVVSLIAVGCTDGFEEMNRDPNQPTQTATSFLLANASRELANNIWDPWLNGRQGMQYAQYWSSNQYTDESRYQERAAINNNAWTFFYARTLKDLQEIIDLVEAEPETYSIYGDPDNQVAVARILKAYTFQIMTDIWGDIPYFSALNDSETLSPAYDAQEDIYRDLLVELAEASAMIKVNASGFTDGDIIYGGDMEKWRRFANSVRMRVAIRMADRDPAAAGQAIQAAAANAFQSNDDNALFSYLESVPNNNPFNQDRLTRQDFAVSAPLVNALQSRNDPRLAAYADPAVATGEYVGLAYGLSQAAAGAIPVDQVSQPSGARAYDYPGDGLTPYGFLRPAMPAILMDYAEVEFILAEAAARGIGGIGNATGHYADAIEASMNFWGITNSAQISSYIAANPLNVANFRQTIGVQKWIALYGQGLQGWIEFRRLDFTGVLVPAVAPLVTVGNNAPSGVPLRTLYPTNEITANPTNYRAAVSSMGADNLATRVWWDVN